MLNKTFADFGIDTKGRTSGEVKCICPQCSPHRKKANYPCLNVSIDKGVWHCWHCGWAGGLKTGPEKGYQRFNVIDKPKKEYKKPEVTLQAPKTNWVEWLKNRGITQEVIDRNKISSGSIYMPQVEEDRDAIQFPYFRNGELTNIKYRDIQKNFRLVAGAERILYGYDDIQDEALVWVEGEVDKLSVEVAGVVSCVSVPDGAPDVKAKNYASKFDFFESAVERLDTVKRHIIAVDGDGPGHKLQEELIRRLGPEKCWIVVWPDGCKDANETLLKYGKEEIFQRISLARACPVEGIIEPIDLYDSVFDRFLNGVPTGMSTGWNCVDNLFTVRPGEWTLVTGIPGAGKSEWLDALSVNLAYFSGWRFGVFSPENQPVEEHVQKLLEKIVDKPFGQGFNNRMTDAELVLGYEFLCEHFDWILPETPTVAQVLDKARILVKRKGINGLIIDPWNEIESSRPAHLSETEYISQCLSTFRKFARENRVHLFLVAHPTKLQKKTDGSYPVPMPYDVSGSAHWRNKADNCITIHRPGSEVEVHIQKIRFKIVGRCGITKLKYNVATGRYSDPNVFFSKPYITVPAQTGADDANTQ